MYLFRCHEDQTDAGGRIAYEIPPSGVFGTPQTCRETDSGRGITVVGGGIIAIDNLIELILLIGNQRDEGRDDDRDTWSFEECRQLVRQGFATPRAHNDKDVVPIKRGVNNFFLRVPKGRQTKRVT